MERRRKRRITSLGRATRIDYSCTRSSTCITARYLTCEIYPREGWLLIVESSDAKGVPVEAIRTRRSSFRRFTDQLNDALSTSSVFPILCGRAMCTQRRQTVQEQGVEDGRRQSWGLPYLAQACMTVSRRSKRCERRSTRYSNSRLLETLARYL